MCFKLNANMTPPACFVLHMLPHPRPPKIALVIEGYWKNSTGLSSVSQAIFKLFTDSEIESLLPGESAHYISITFRFIYVIFVHTGLNFAGWLY